MRLIIFGALIYLAYRAVKSWMSAGSQASSKMTRRAAGEIDDIMVKDPICEVYFPRRNGVPLTFEGRELLFCSPECRDKFIEQNKEGTD